MISVVIPVRNEASTITRAISPFLMDTSRHDIEVIIADGRSTDRTREVVSELAARDPRIRLVDNPAGAIPDGLNAAIRASHGDVIVRMDGHAEPSADYLAACLSVLSSSGAWNVGGRMVKTGGTRAARAASAAASSPFGIGGGLRHHLLTAPTDISSVWLGCWPRWVFERIGLFDPEMIVNEDEELNRRILDAGGNVRFDPSIWASYQSRASWTGIVRQYRRYGTYKVRSVQKHPSILRLRHLIPAALVAVVVVSAAYALVVPAGVIVAFGTVLAWIAGATYSARSVAESHGSTVPDVLTAFACLHVGYGIGFWVGFVRFAPRWFIRRSGTVPALVTLPQAYVVESSMPGGTPKDAR